MRSISLPCLIDEVQYAPKILSPIKRLVDGGAPSGSVSPTGSQNYEAMRGVGESLAGRVAIPNLFGFSDEEKNLKEENPAHYFKHVHGIAFPKLFVEGFDANRELYLSSYQQTYIEKDVQELIGI